MTFHEDLPSGPPQHHFAASQSRPGVVHGTVRDKFAKNGPFSRDITSVRP
jgi:hypothetical protein